MHGNDSETALERDILYELFIYSEWVQEPELVTKFGYGADTASTKSGLISWFLPTPSISAPVRWFKTSYPPWQLSLSSDNRLLAVLRDTCAEIRGTKDDFAKIIASCQLPYDPLSQFRCLSWSTDTTILAISSSAGQVCLFDLAGEMLYAIEEDPLAKLEEGGFALVNMLWTEEKTKKTQWSYELITVAYNGQVRGYFVNSESFLPTFQIVLPTGNGSIGAAVYHPQYSLILIGGGSPRLMENADADDPSLVSSEAGISAWKIVTEEPFLQRVETVHQDTQSNTLSSFVSLFRPQAEDSVCALKISPSGKQLLCLHASGVASLWSLPGLILIKLWRSYELPSYQTTNPHLLESEKLIQEKTKGFHNLLHVDWWSEDKMIIVRRCGSICVISIETGRNLLGDNPEWFGVAPRLVSIANKGFLTIECEWQMGLSKTRANSSFIGSELESSFLSDADQDEEEEMRPSWFDKIISIGPVRKALEYVLDSSLEKVKPRRVVKIYRLLGLKSTTPKELFAVKINNGEYLEALHLAERFELDSDPVYQHQWRKTEPTKTNIDALLHKVKNKSWVLQECLQKLADDPISSRELLLYGLRVTSIFAITKTPADEIPQDVAEEQELQEKLVKKMSFDQLTLEQKWMIECRRKFLHYLDAQQIYESFSDRFDPAEMAWFRQQSPLEAAVHFARGRRPEAVVNLLTFHTDDLSKHWLPILNQFPETENPNKYSKLLPYVSSKPPHKIRHWQAAHIRTEIDWAENVMKVCPFAEQWRAAEQEFYAMNPDCEEWRSEKPLDADLITRWYISRIRDIEMSTSLTDNALELVNLAYQKLRPSGEFAAKLMRLQDNLVTVAMLTYDCSIEGVRLKDIERKNPEEQLKLIMKNATEENYLTCVREWLVPFVERCERAQPGARFELLKNYFAEQAEARLDRVVQVWKIFKTEFVDVIPGLGHEIDFCMTCCQASKVPSQLNQAYALLNMLPEKPHPSTTELDDLYEKLESLKQRLAVAQCLSDFGTVLNISQVRELEENADEAYKTIQETFLRLSKEKLSREDWFQIASVVLLKVREELSLELDKCTELLCDALIGSMDRDNIKTTGCMLSLKSRPSEMVFPHRLDEAKSLKLVLEAAKKYFDSATSYSDQCVGFARSCLALVQDLGSGDVRKELNLIESLPLLNKFGIQMLPVHVRSRDKLAIIREVLVANRTNYKNFNKISQLAQLLGVYDEDATHEGLILSSVVGVALKEQDYRVASNLCQRIVQGGHITGWKACARLGSCENFKEFQERKDLIGFCVVHAPAEHLKTLLDELNKVELQEYYSQLEQKFSQKQDTALADAKNLVKNMIKPDGWLGSVKETVKGLTIRHSSREGTLLSDPDEERSSMMSLSLSPFYSGLWGNPVVESRFEQNFTAFHSEGVSLPEIGTVLHYAAVSDRVNESKSAEAVNDDMLLSLSQQYMIDDVLLAICHLLHLSEPKKAEKLFLEDLPYTDYCLQIGAYYFALACVRAEAEAGLLDADTFVLMSKDDLISRVTSMEFASSDAEEFQKLVLKFAQLKLDLYQAQLVQEQSGGTVDVGRFGHDEVYKRETIFGMAFCEDSQTLRVALNLAKHYGVSQFEVCFGHLEHLFINCPHAPAIEDRIQQENLLDILMQDKSKFKLLLKQKVFPILIGTNYDHIAVYYDLILKCAEDENEKKESEAYIALLKEVDEHLDGIDFKQLISPDAVEQRRSLTEIVDMDNIDVIAKICGRFKSILKAISRSTVIQVFLKNVFVEAGRDPKERMKDLFKEHLKYIGYLSPTDTIDFVKDVCFDPFIASGRLSRVHRLEFLKIFVVFAKQKAKAPRKPNAPQSALTWADVQSKLAAFLQHLQKIEDGFVGELLDFTQNPDLEGYVEMFEMTAGEKDQLLDLLTNCALSECNPMLIESLLSICPASEVNDRPSDIFLRATKVALDRLKKKDKNGRDASDDHGEMPLAFQTRKPITVLKRLLSTSRKITGDRTTFDKAVVELIHNFCLDKELALSDRLAVLRLLKDNSWAVNEEDEALLLHLETMALLQETWPDVSVSQTDTETGQGRENVFSRLLNASSDEEQLDTLCRLLTSWPALDIRPSPWYQILMKMSELPSPSGTKLLSIHREHTDLTLEECTELVDSWAPQITSQERTLFLLESQHPELHEKAIVGIDEEEMSESIRDRILQLNLTASLISTPHYTHLMDRLLERDDFQAMSGSVSRSLVASNFVPEAASLSVITSGIPKALQTFTESLNFFNSKK